MTRTVSRMILLLVMTILLTSCSGSKEVNPIEQDENYSAAVVDYMAGINAREFESNYWRISEESRAAISLEDYTARNKNIYTGIDARDIQVRIDETLPADAPEGVKGSGRREVRYTTTMKTTAGDLTFAGSVRVTGLPGVEPNPPTFQLEWNSSVIFPNLGDTDKVRVNTQTGARGSIRDREGYLMAGEGIVKSVGLVPGKLNPDTREADIARIAQILGISPETITKQLGQAWVKDDTFVPLRRIPESDEERKAQLLEIPGVRVNDAKARVYPLGEAAAHLIGYIQTISAEELAARPDQGYTTSSVIGKAGLESLYEERLRGVDGCRITITDAQENEKAVLVERPVVHGQDVTITIDSSLQRSLYAVLAADKSCAAVMNPKNGEMLALLSTPAYDPNLFVLGMPDATWQAWQQDEARPMYNRFKASVVPGSSFKAITAALGLDSGAFTADEDFGHSGRSWQASADWGNYFVTTLTEYDEPANLANALLVSDNIYFAKAALKIGAQDFAERLTKIGFGEPMPFVFGLTASTFGTGGEFASQIEVADSGFGQGKVLVNPLHMASIYSAFVNAGDMIAPTLEAGGEPTVWKPMAFTQDACNAILSDLVQVVESPYGTGYEARIPGRKLAGKTGTAEIKESKEDQNGTEIGWYVTFTADEADPNPMLFVGMVEDVKGRGGSHYVFPAARMVFE